MGSVLFLAVPENRASLMKGLRSFRLDPSILLPIEPDESNRNIENLSPEMILAGMLRVISACTGNDTLLPGKKIKSGDIVDLETVKLPSDWIDYYRRFVLTVKPEIYHEFSGASIVKAGNGEFDMALEISAVLEGLFPGSPGVLLNKALILEQKAAMQEKYGHDVEKENAEALEAYEAALSIEPVLPDTSFNAGFFFMHLGEYRRAFDCFSHYVSDGDETDKKKQAKKIIKDIKSQGLDDENFMEAYNCVNRGNEEKGLFKIREFLERNPKVWNGWFVLGWALRKLGRYGDGIESLKKAVEFGGSGVDLKNEMAICLMELGDFKGARRELELALRETSNNVKIISNLGVLALKTGNGNEAESYFRTVLELSPNDALAKHFLDVHCQN
ncbi:MAG: hypothetical protein LBH42_04220 [Treponema sp.]|jgi:tetratricopeptide (TPR) repeat protein|nr:hypothetical protein [Treponema sp.]